MFNYFDKAYVINLDTRKDRWRHIQNTIKTMSITNWERISAVKHDDGGKGCYLSHLKVLDKIIASKNGKALVLEDDAELYDDWKLIWNKSLRQLPNDWEIVYLGYNVDPHTFKPSEHSPSLISPNILRLYGCLTTHAYAVRSTAIASSIMEIIGKQHIRCLVGKGNKYPSIDVVYSCLVTNRFNTYGIYPMLFKQLNGRSDIIKIEINYPLRSNVKAVLKKLGYSV